MASNNAMWERAGNALDANLQRIREGEQKRQLAQVLAALQAGPNPEAMKRLYAMNPQLAMQVEDQLHERGERQRATTSREAMSAILLGGDGAPTNALAMPAPPAPAPMPPVLSGGGSQLPRDRLAPLPEGATSAANPSAPAPQGNADQTKEWEQYIGQLAQWADTPEKWDQAVDYLSAQGYSGAAQFKGRFSPEGRSALMQRGGVSDAQRQLIEADPEAFLTFQGKRLEVTGKQLKNHIDMNNAAMQLLGSVHDQASYDAAKQQALQLYSSFGEDASDFIGKLPPEYNPQTIKMLQLRGMDTSKQLGAIARENNIESQIEVREGRLDEYERHNRAMESNVRRGQDITDKRVRGSVGYQGRGRNAGVKRGDLIGPVYQRGSKRVQYSKSKGGYVDLATGERVN
ncbi:MAG: hypothetical protein ACLGHC_01830 [Alphaproteobacteria bacterium]